MVRCSVTACKRCTIQSWPSCPVPALLDQTLRDSNCGTRNSSRRCNSASVWSESHISHLERVRRPLTGRDRSRPHNETAGVCRATLNMAAILEPMVGSAADREASTPVPSPDRPGMRTLTALLTLTRDTATLWWRIYPRLLTWSALGFGVHHLGQHASALVGSRYQLVATMLFVLGVLGWLACLVMMIHAVKPALWTPRHLRPGAVSDVVPQPLFVDERGIDVLTLALGPFLAVYSVWGLVEEEVSALFFANLSREGLAEPDSWSISFAPDRLGYYVTLTAGAWLLGKLVTVLRVRLRARDGVALGMRVVSIAADGTAVFGLFVALGIGAGQLREWWQGRMISVWLGQTWRGLVDRLPSWHLWFDATLPEVVRDAV